MPDRLFKSSERAARKMGITRSRFITNAVSHYLHDIARCDVTERLNAVYCAMDQNESGVSDVLSKLQMKVLRRDTW